MSLLLSKKPSCSTPEELNIPCDVCMEQFKIFEDLKHELDNCNNLQQDEKEKIIKKIDLFQNNLQTYIFHLVRGKYQRRKFEDIGELSDDSTVVVADYMMKLLFQKLFEPQKRLVWQERGITTWHDVPI